MDRDLIEKLYLKLNEEYWGFIHPSWFAYIDLTADTSGYEDDHIAFQQLLQSIN